MTWDEWEQMIRDFELISCKVSILNDLSNDEQILANDYMVKLPHPELGEWWYVPTPVEYEKTPVSVQSAAPHIGEHTDEILSGLGYSEEQLSDLRERTVV